MHATKGLAIDLHGRKGLKLVTVDLSGLEQVSSRPICFEIPRKCSGWLYCKSALADWKMQQAPS